MQIIDIILCCLTGAHKPDPVGRACRVFVGVGMGMAQCKNTHGLPWYLCQSLKFKLMFFKFFFFSLLNKVTLISVLTPETPDVSFAFLVFW